MIVLENPWRQAGIYTRGLSFQDRKRNGKPMIPTEIEVRNLVVVDSTDVVGTTNQVSLNMQISYYTGDPLLREWEIQERVKLAEATADGQVTSESRPWNLIAGLDRKELICEARMGQFQDSLFFRVANQMLVGSSWKIREEYIVAGDQHKGLIRGLPLEGDYVFVITSENIGAGRPEFGEAAEVAISRDLADSRNLSVGSYFHAWRCPTLPHEGVMIRCVVIAIIEEGERTRLGKFMIINVGPMGEVEHHSRRGWRPFKALAEQALQSSSTVDRQTGDDDGDKWCITTELVERFEPWAAKQMGLEEYILDPPAIMPDQFPAQHRDEEWEWTSEEDRMTIGGHSQTTISDLSARRAMDIIHGWHDGEKVENHKYWEIGNETELRLELCRMVQAMIWAKKHPVVQTGDNLRINADEGCPVDTYRRIERILCANKGHLGVTETESGFIQPIEIRTSLAPDDVPTIDELISRLEERKYPYARVLRAIHSAYKKIWDIYLTDAKGITETGGNADLDHSKIRWRSETNYRQRCRRMGIGSKHKGLIRASGNKNRTEGMSWETAAFLTGQFQGVLKDRKSFIRQVAEELLAARKTRVKIRGEEYQIFVRKQEDQYIVYQGPKSRRVVVNEQDIELLEDINTTSRENTVLQKTRHRIPQVAEEIKDSVIVPADLQHLFETSKEYARTIIEASLLCYLHDTKIGTSGATNWWTYALNMVTDITVLMILAPTGLSPLDEPDVGGGEV